MKYHDSIIQAEKKMTSTVKQLQRWHIPASPFNYAVSYEYISGTNKALIKAINKQLSLGKKLDSFFIEEIYCQHILGQSNFREDIISDVDEVLTHVQRSNKRVSKSMDGFINKLDANIDNIQSNDEHIANNALQQIYQASRTFKIQQQQLTQQLFSSQQQAKKLKIELAEIKKDIYLDPLTKFHNRKAMSKHLEAWMSEDPDKKIAAIVINIDKFSQVKDKFGPLIGDVLLSKIATKISSYVGESGFPIRSAGDEFLILLPEIHSSIAGEIAEKIRQGVEKLRFISSKSGMRLPQMTISLAVNEFKVSENINTIVNATRNTIDEVQNHAYNQVSFVPS